MATRAEDEAWVLDEYRTLYGRTPAPNELAHVVDALQNGTYTRARWDAESQPGGDPSATVTRIYQEVVGKPPQAAGVAYYAERLANGSMTQAQIRAEMSAKTAENRQMQGNTLPQASDDMAGKENARAYIDDTLNTWGLGGLGNFAWDEIQKGTPNTRIIQDLRNQQAYKDRFKGMALRQQKGYAAIDESTYINWETQARQFMRSIGMPEGFFDSPDDFANFIGHDVSLSELQDRMTLGFAELAKAPVEAVQQLQAIFGLNQGDLAAAVLDPDVALPVLQRKWAAAQASGAAVQSGYGGLNQTEAERLASLGITPDQAQQGFGQLVQSAELFGTLPGEIGGAITREQQQEAVFANNATDRQLIVKKGEQRVSAGSGASAFAVGNQGVTSLNQEIRR